MSKSMTEPEGYTESRRVFDGAGVRVERQARQSPVALYDTGTGLVLVVSSEYFTAEQAEMLSLVLGG